MLGEMLKFAQGDPRISHALDTAVAVPMVAAVLSIVPDWAMLPGLIWYLLQIWESKTVRGLRERLIKALRP